VFHLHFLPRAELVPGQGCFNVPQVSHDELIPLEGHYRLQQVLGVLGDDVIPGGGWARLGELDTYHPAIDAAPQESVTAVSIRWMMRAAFDAPCQARLQRFHMTSG
jgi:hypothetical protein